MEDGNCTANANQVEFLLLKVSALKKVEIKVVVSCKKSSTKGLQQMLTLEFFLTLFKKRKF